MKLAIFAVFAFFFCCNPLGHAGEKPSCDLFFQKPACHWIASSGATHSTTDAEDQYCFMDCDLGPAPLAEFVTSIAIYEAEIMKEIGFQPQNPVIPEGDGQYTLIDLDGQFYHLLVLALYEPDPRICEFLIWHSSNIGLLVGLNVSPEEIFKMVVRHLGGYFPNPEHDPYDVEAYCSLWLDPLF